MVNNSERFFLCVAAQAISMWTQQPSILWRSGLSEQLLHWMIDLHGTMLEFCEDLRTMQDHAAAVEPGWKRIIAILTNEVIPTEQMGFVAEDIMQTDEVSGSSSHGSRGQVDVAQQTAAQRPELAQRQELVIKDDCIELEGVRVLPTSTIAALNAACKYLGIKQGGSKYLLWNRISPKVDADRWMVAKEIARQAQPDGERRAVGQPLNSGPLNYEEVLAHNLTHLPYRPWCAQCVKGKARPDYRKKGPQRFTKREYPSICFDLCYTGKRVDNALGDVSAEGPHEKRICFVMHEPDRGYRCSTNFPFADLSLMAKSIVKFVHQLGYTTVGLRCDQEPAMLKVQELAFKSLNNLGYLVLIDNPPIRDDAANEPVEGSIHRICQLATVCSAVWRIRLARQSVIL